METPSLFGSSGLGSIQGADSASSAHKPPNDLEKITKEIKEAFQALKEAYTKEPSPINASSAAPKSTIGRARGLTTLFKKSTSSAAAAEPQKKVSDEKLEEMVNKIVKAIYGGNKAAVVAALKIEAGESPKLVRNVLSKVEEKLSKQVVIQNYKASPETLATTEEVKNLAEVYLELGVPPQPGVSSDIREALFFALLNDVPVTDFKQAEGKAVYFLTNNDGKPLLVIKPNEEKALRPKDDKLDNLSMGQAPHLKPFFPESNLAAVSLAATQLGFSGLHGITTNLKDTNDQDTLCFVSEFIEGEFLIYMADQAKQDRAVQPFLEKEPSRPDNLPQTRQRSGYRDGAQPGHETRIEATTTTPLQRSLVTSTDNPSLYLDQLDSEKLTAAFGSEQCIESAQLNFIEDYLMDNRDPGCHNLMATLGPGGGQVLRLYNFDYGQCLGLSGLVTNEIGETDPGDNPSPYRFLPGFKTPFTQDVRERVLAKSSTEETQKLKDILRNNNFTDAHINSVVKNFGLRLEQLQKFLRENPEGTPNEFKQQ